MADQSATLSNLFDQPPLRHVITRKSLAQILDKSEGQFGLMCRCETAHAVVTQYGRAYYPPTGNETEEKSTLLHNEREEVFYVRENPGDATCQSFWLQLHIKAINEPVMGAHCTPVEDGIELSKAFLKPILNNKQDSYNRNFYYRPFLENDHIQAFEALVRQVAGKPLKPDYTPPRSPRYTL